MGLELIAIFIAGIAGAGIGLMLRALSRKRLPLWTAPVTAGVAMIGTSIYSEYDWYPHMRSQLPAAAVITETRSHAVFWRPWTFVFPLRNEFHLIDTRSLMRHPEAPQIVVAQMWRFARWDQATEWLVAFDCAAPARVDLTANIRISDAGVLEGGTWAPVDPGDTALRTACNGG
jgi:hypothetical protein